MINLYEYITQGGLLADLEKSKGTYSIVSDIVFENTSDNITFYSFDNIFLNNHLPGETIICISQKFNTKDMILIDSLIKNTHHRISLNPGLMSMREKNMPEENDIITMIQHGYQVREPYHTKQVIDSMIGNKPSYHRIHNLYIPEKLSKKSKHASIVQVSGNNNGNLTVLSGISCVDTVASALHVASKGSIDMFDLYAWSHINTTIDKELQQSINKSKRLLIIFDHKATEELWVFVNTLLRNHCDSDIQIHYLLPQYHLVQSILSEYIYEEAVFDERAIIEFIESILDAMNNA